MTCSEQDGDSGGGGVGNGRAQAWQEAGGGEPGSRGICATLATVWGFKVWSALLRPVSLNI